MVARNHLAYGVRDTSPVTPLHTLGLPLSRYWRLGQDPCAINEVEFSAVGFTVLSMNETYHLKQPA